MDKSSSRAVGNGWWIEFGYETNRRQVRRCVISLKTILEHYGRFSDFVGQNSAAAFWSSRAAPTQR